MRRFLILGLSAAIFLIVVPLALAETTREAYVEKVEPICKVNSEANGKILKGAKQKVQSGQLKQAGAQFSRAAASLNKTYTQLKAVEQPAADAAKLGKWLTLVKKEATTLEKIASALKAGQKTQAQTQVLQLTHNANTANAEVTSFEFKYCKFEPSKYT
jgi:hypothetical protein